MYIMSHSSLAHNVLTWFPPHLTASVRGLQGVRIATRVRLWNTNLLRVHGYFGTYSNEIPAYALKLILCNGIYEFQRRSLVHFEREYSDVLVGNAKVKVRLLYFTSG